MIPVKHSDTCLDKAHTPFPKIIYSPKIAFRRANSRCSLRMLSSWDVPKQEHGGDTEDGALPL